MQGYSIILNVFVEQLTINMVLVLAQAVIHLAETILAGNVEVPGETLYTILVEKRFIFTRRAMMQRGGMCN